MAIVIYKTTIDISIILRTEYFQAEIIIGWTISVAKVTIDVHIMKTNIMHILKL